MTCFQFFFGGPVFRGYGAKVPTNKRGRPRQAVGGFGGVEVWYFCWRVFGSQTSAAMSGMVSQKGRIEVSFLAQNLTKTSNWRVKLFRT